MSDAKSLRRVRKLLLSAEDLLTPPQDGSLDLVAEAVIAYTSEDPNHPVDHLFDDSSGPGASRWVAAAPDTPQTLLVSFDNPRAISRIVLETEERDAERTQQVQIAASSDGGQTFRDVLVQEFNFSPTGATFQREGWRVDLATVTTLRLVVVPNKRGSGKASLTTLRLYA